MFPTPSTSNPSPPALSSTIVGLVMLLVGIVIGYLIHPILTPDPASIAPTQVAAAPSPKASEAIAAPTATPDTAQATQAAAIMEAVIARTRHFKGNPTAPVTLIEFGDFQ